MVHSGSGIGEWSWYSITFITCPGPLWLHTVDQYITHMTPQETIPKQRPDASTLPETLFARSLAMAAEPADEERPQVQTSSEHSQDQVTAAPEVCSGVTSEPRLRIRGAHGGCLDTCLQPSPKSYFRIQSQANLLAPRPYRTLPMPMQGATASNCVSTLGYR